MIDFSVPLAGLNQASQSLNRVAQTIANAGATGGDSIDLSTAMVGLMQSTLDARSNIKVIQTEDKLSQAVLNIFG